MKRRILLFAAAMLAGFAASALDKAAAPQLDCQLLLVRYDMPRGLSDGYAPTRQLAIRRGGHDAVDWPRFTLDGRPLWAKGAEERVPLTLRKGAAAMPVFQSPGDDVIEPGGHWLRAVQWVGGRSHIYAADQTARCANSSATPPARYELWTFPLLIKGEGGPVVKQVELRYDGEIIYTNDGPLRSLTLLLPASAKGHQYELRVGGRAPMKFNVGLNPQKLGDPRESVIAFRADVAGEGPKITVSMPTKPEVFPNQKEWDADLAAMAKEQPQPQRAADARGQGMARFMGIEVPSSPFTIYAMALPHGMSGGFFKKGGNVDDYAKLIAETGYDAVFEPVTTIPPAEDKESFERKAAALALRGVKLGLQYDNNWTRPSLQNPNLPILAHTLADWHAPLYRSLSLTAQRFARLPNFAGIDIGADNAAYARSWFWAPPVSDRPWGEAMMQFLGTAQPKIPRAASLGPPESPMEVPAAKVADFMKYVDRADAAFQEYGYFAEAVREVNPALAFTTASFGSGAGDGARGGWPSASIPARAMFNGLTLQQAYDWNDKHAAKPMHAIALIDRLHSYAPRKRTWALLDNYRFLYGREAWQRAVALALTRGITGLGTDFVAAPGGESSGADTLEWQREMYGWIHRYGGVYAHTEPDATIGIFFSHQESLLRPVVRGENAEAADVLAGSHEGKVTEALFMCHAAGWPSRVVTYQELAAGPLPRSMKVLLLVGLEAPDASWNWAPGVEPMLKQFTAGGGRILSDDESYCPVPAEKLGIRVPAYVGAGNVDPTPLLMERNAENIANLRAAMQSVAEPVAVSDSPALWAVPSRSYNTQYVTVVNQAFAQGDEAAEFVRLADPRATKPELWKTKANASLFVKPQVGVIRWNTSRPIYDLRLGRKITPDEAAKVDLTKDGFRVYALPPAEIAEPELAVEVTPSGYYDAKVTITHPTAINGVPVQVTVGGGGETVTLYGVTGAATRLPLHGTRTPGDYTVTATELLSGLVTSTKLTIAPPSPAAVIRSNVRIRDVAAVRKFAGRKQLPLTIALTPEQMSDATISRQARELAAYYTKRGRSVSTMALRAGTVVQSLQPVTCPHRYPQWKTIPADLVLFGTTSTNVLLLDQARGQILPRDLSQPKPGEADIVYTRSAFEGECDVLNIFAADAPGVASAVNAITSIK